MSHRTITRIVLIAHAIHVISEKFGMANYLHAIVFQFSWVGERVSLSVWMTFNNKGLQYGRNKIARYISILLIIRL